MEAVEPSLHMDTVNEVVELRKRIRRELQPIVRRLNAPESESGASAKDAIRADHANQRYERNRTERQFLIEYLDRLLPSFADADEVDVERIEAVLEPVQPGTDGANLFRLATLLWSVPVSRGYGRRLRFLVRDRQNGKLMGLIALGDPVFNLRARDEWVGWSVDQKVERLCNVMDAYVLGAVPPYSHLIGGKLVAALVASREVHEAFAARYGNREGLISHTNRRAKLALVTTTSALGRSSVYNRLKIEERLLFEPIGYTAGWGHFHVNSDLFQAMRKLLELIGHPYARGYKYGNGPNWKMRVIRGALEEVGMDVDVLRHGIRRQVFAVPLARNTKDYLCGKHTKVSRWEVLAASDMSEYCVQRWMLPRYIRDGVLFANTTRCGIRQALMGAVASLPTSP